MSIFITIIHHRHKKNEIIVLCHFIQLQTLRSLSQNLVHKPQIIGHHEV